MLAKVCSLTTNPFLNGLDLNAIWSCQGDPAGGPELRQRWTTDDRRLALRRRCSSTGATVLAVRLRSPYSPA